MGVKYWIKNSLAYALYYTGALHLYRRLKLRGKAVVLTYHRVLSDEERRNSFSNQSIVVSPRTFERQLRFLKRHCRLLSAEDFEHHLRERKPFATGSCLITFDDGWRDNYTNALPILRRYRAPAIIFLPLSYIGTGRLFWQERLGRMLLWLCDRRPDGAEEVLQRVGLSGTPPADPNVRRQWIEAAVNKLKARPIDEIETMLEDTGRLVPKRLDPGSDVYLDWHEVDAMAREGISFGSHGVSHWPLTRLEPQRLAEELRQSKRELERACAAPITAVAYPNGDADATVTARAADSGYAVGFTTRRGHAAIDDDPLAVRRVNINEAVTRTIPMFYCRVLGLL